jgi:hypothetical protein
VSIHINGFGRKDFEISFLFKRNNLEVSRKKKNRSGNVIRAASAYVSIKGRRYKVCGCTAGGDGAGDAAVTTSALRGEYPTIAVDHAFC